MLLTSNPTTTHVPMESPAVVDKASFQQFVRAQETAVYTFCYRMLGSTYLADSVAQSAFLDVYARFPAVCLADVLRAARRFCREQLQRGNGDGMETAVSDNQYLFNGLTIPEREVLALYYGCQLDMNEVAAILSCSVVAVRATLRQGRWHAANLGQRPSMVQSMMKEIG